MKGGERKVEGRRKMWQVEGRGIKKERDKRKERRREKGKEERDVVREGETCGKRKGEAET